jgi:hypothetical protein
LKSQQKLAIAAALFSALFPALFLPQTYLKDPAATTHVAQLRLENAATRPEHSANYDEISNWL